MSLGTLIAQWHSGGKDYRAIAVGRYTNGYEDEILIERADTDALGGIRWVEKDRWSPKGTALKDDMRPILLEGLRSANNLCGVLQKQLDEMHGKRLG